jgi:hypothetical protein
MIERSMLHGELGVVLALLTVDDADEGWIGLENEVTGRIAQAAIHKRRHDANAAAQFDNWRTRLQPVPQEFALRAFVPTAQKPAFESSRDLRVRQVEPAVVHTHPVAPKLDQSSKAVMVPIPPLTQTLPARLETQGDGGGDATDSTRCPHLGSNGHIASKPSDA